MKGWIEEQVGRSKLEARVLHTKQGLHEMSSIQGVGNPTRNMNLP